MKGKNNIQSALNRITFIWIIKYEQYSKELCETFAPFPSPQGPIYINPSKRSFSSQEEYTYKQAKFSDKFQNPVYWCLWIIACYIVYISMGNAVAQLVEALRYKPEGCGFDSRWCHWNLSST